MSTPTPTTSDPSTAYPDPTSSQVALSSLDFLLIELVPTAYRITADLALRDEEWIASSNHAPGTKSRTQSTAGQSQAQAQTQDDGASSVAGTAGGGGGGAGAGATATVDEDEAREAVFRRLEGLGYRVGLGIVERVSRSTPRPTTPLDTIKFLCKDLWTLLFRKQIDNLKTNHRGIYVLTDNTFKPLSRMSFDTKKIPPNDAAYNPEGLMMGDPNTLARVQPFLYFPAGLIRGCLASLGIQATVNAECTGLPGVTFQIRTIGAKA